jgi:hypothetical protein
MTAIDNTPSNRNFLSPLNFKFILKKAPHVNFFIQRVNIPSITLISPQPNNPFIKTPIPGEHLDYGDLKITFKVDEELQNYLEIRNWMVGLGKPENFDQYKELQDKPIASGDGIYSDITLAILASTKMPNYEIVYTDAFPVSLSEITFNTTDPDVNYIEASAVFKYTYFTITNI